MMKKHLLNVDWLLVAPAIVLILLSLTTLYSVNPVFFRDQLFSLAFASILFLACSQINFQSFISLRFPIYILSLVTFFVVLIIGLESRGATRWIEIFGVSIQFSEIFKPFLAISLASFLSTRENTSIRTFIKTILLLVPIFVLVYFQPDLGNALIYTAVTGLTMLIYGFPLLWFGLSLLPLLIALPSLWDLLHDYQRQRILTFIRPTSDPLGSSYNLIQAVIAVGSGGIIGKGLSESTQSGLRFLPERHTDFIFATLSESLGFVGGLFVILLFAFLLHRILVIFSRADTPFGKIFAACAFCIVAVHFFVNIGMNIGILPIVGVTLPFVSFGGSSLVSNAILLGFLSALSISTQNKHVLVIR